MMAGIEIFDYNISQKPGLNSKIHIHGRTGASVGVETESSSVFIAGVPGQIGAALNDLWTIPGEEELLSRWWEGGKARAETIDAKRHYHRLQLQDFLEAIVDDRAPLVTGEKG